MPSPRAKLGPSAEYVTATTQVHRLSDAHGVVCAENNNEGATIYDTSADSPVAIVTLDGDEMWELVTLWLDGYCSICGNTTNQGHHLCAQCAAEESRIWAGYSY